MYEFNKKKENNHNSLYTNSMLFSPLVEVFRNEKTCELLEHPYVVGVISAPAPNAGVARKKGVPEK